MRKTNPLISVNETFGDIQPIFINMITYHLIKQLLVWLPSMWLVLNHKAHKPVKFSQGSSCFYTSTVQLFENIVGKGDLVLQHNFSFFHTVFSTLLENSPPVSSSLKLSCANLFFYFGIACSQILYTTPVHIFSAFPCYGAFQQYFT